MCLNVNKQGVVLDFKDLADRASALDLVATADVFIQNFRGGVIERLGLGYDTVRARNPRIVYCSVSGFGESGPLAKEACADFIMQAYSGFARLNGAPGDDVEAFRFTGFLDLTTSIVAVEGVLAALLAREATGIGEKLEISMLQASLEMQFTRIAELLGGGASLADGKRIAGLVPDRAYPALDGEVFVTAHDDAQWRGFCAAIGPPRSCRRSAVRAQCRPRAQPCGPRRHRVADFRRAPDDLVDARVRAPPRPVRDGPELRAAALSRAGARQCDDRGRPDRGLGHGRRRRSAVAFHANPRRRAAAACPRRGHGTGSRFDRAHCVTRARRQVVSAALPLAGVRVVEAASGVAGPMAACRLGDLGAEVVKVEHEGGDWMRGCPPFLADGMSSVFFALNRCKRGTALRRVLQRMPPCCCGS